MHLRGLDKTIKLSAGMVTQVEETIDDLDDNTDDELLCDVYTLVRNIAKKLDALKALCDEGGK